MNVRDTDLYSPVDRLIRSNHKQETRLKKKTEQKNDTIYSKLILIFTKFYQRVCDSYLVEGVIETTPAIVDF